MVESPAVYITYCGIFLPFYYKCYLLHHVLIMFNGTNSASNKGDYIIQVQIYSSC
jgi:hypothetical protein